MDQGSNNQSSTRRSKEEIQQLIKEYESTSGVTVKEFCRLHKINEGVFYTARKRDRISQYNKKSGFTPIAQIPPLPTGAILFAEVKGIKLYQPVSAEYLKSLIA